MGRKGSGNKPKAGLYLYLSNNSESLADLCAILMNRQPLSDPLAQEKVVVMALGMQNFIKQRISLQNRIFAAVDFAQIWQLIFQTHHLVHPRAPHQDLYDRNHLTWNIFSLIAKWNKPPLSTEDAEAGAEVRAKEAGADIAAAVATAAAHTNSPMPDLNAALSGDLSDLEAGAGVSLSSAALSGDAAAGGVVAGGVAASGAAASGAAAGVQHDIYYKLRQYLKDDTFGDKAYELSAKIADTFDQYQLYRPEWINAWNEISLSDFDEYEQNPQDPDNPINVFIQEQCESFMRRRSGLLAAQAKAEQEEAMAQAAATMASITDIDDDRLADVEATLMGLADVADFSDEDELEAAEDEAIADIGEITSLGNSTKSLSHAARADMLSNDAMASRTDVASRTAVSSRADIATHDNVLSRAEMASSEAGAASKDVPQSDGDITGTGFLGGGAVSALGGMSRSKMNLVRNLFQSNVWQIKLWCLLRYNLELFADDSATGIPFDEEYQGWLLNHLDRAQIMQSLIWELNERAPAYTDDDEQYEDVAANLGKSRATQAVSAATAPLGAESGLDAGADAAADQGAGVDGGAAAGAEKTAIKGMFERVFIFGVSAMPKVVMNFLRALSHHCSVNVLMLDPCQEYWGDLAPRYRDNLNEYRKRMSSARDWGVSRVFKGGYLESRSPGGKSGKRHDFLQVPEATLSRDDYDEYGERVEGHPLLLSYGQQGRDNLYLFYDSEEIPNTITCFSEPDVDEDFVECGYERNGEIVKLITKGSLLAYIQSRMLNLNHPKEFYVIDHDDYSLSIHSCHTKRREVEVLHDAILSCFNRAKIEGRELFPRDIVVMVPTINEYAPLISAVFGGSYQENDPDYIPFVIADQTEAEANNPAQTVLKLLSIGTTRITSSFIIDLLSEESLAKRFGLDYDQVQVIAAWLQDSNVYWGLDDFDVEHYAEIKIPGTLSQGVERMILGMMVGDSQNLPVFSEIEGSDSIILGKFWDFLLALKELRIRFTPQLSLSASGWATELSHMITERFFDQSEETSRNLAAVTDIVDELKKIFGHLNHQPKINLPVFAATLRQGLDAQRHYQPFLRDKVNFCSLMPMRSVPFQHVFILGLNEFDFPREAVAPGFNMMTSNLLFERGDRSRGIDDRFLFLESLLSARRSIYLSYIGQSPIDKRELNPSTVVTELLAYICDHCVVEGAELAQDTGRVASVKNRIFIQERLNSYSSDNYMAKSYEGQYLSDSDKAALAAQYQQYRTNQYQTDLSLAYARSVTLTQTASPAAPGLAARNDTAHDADSVAVHDAVHDADCVTASAAAQRMANEAAPSVANEAAQWEHMLLTQPQRIPSFMSSYIIEQSKMSRRDEERIGAGVFAYDYTQKQHFTLELKELTRFMREPSKSFVRDRLSIKLESFTLSSLPDDESFALNTIQQNTLVKAILEQPDHDEQLLQLWGDMGKLPYGLFQEQTAKQVTAGVVRINQVLSQDLGLPRYQEPELLPCEQKIWRLSLPLAWLEQGQPLPLQDISALLVERDRVDALNTIDMPLLAIASATDQESELIALLQGNSGFSHLSAATWQHYLKEKQAQGPSSDSAVAYLLRAQGLSSAPHPAATQTTELSQAQPAPATQSQAKPASAALSQAKPQQVTPNQTHSAAVLPNQAHLAPVLPNQESRAPVASSSVNHPTAIAQAWPGGAGASLLSEEDLIHFEVTMQTHCQQRPVLLLDSSRLNDSKCEEYETAQGESIKLYKLTMTKIRPVLSALGEAMTQYFYDGSLVPIYMLDYDGNCWVLLPFTAAEIQRLIYGWLLCYFSAQTAPYPCMDSLLKNSRFEGKKLVGNIEKTSYMSGAQNKWPNFSYDAYSSYLFDSLETMFSYPRLYAKAQDFYSFYQELIAPHFVPYDKALEQGCAPLGQGSTSLGQGSISLGQGGAPVGQGSASLGQDAVQAAPASPVSSQVAAQAAAALGVVPSQVAQPEVVPKRSAKKKGASGNGTVSAASVATAIAKDTTIATEESTTTVTVTATATEESTTTVTVTATARKANVSIAQAPRARRKRTSTATKAASNHADTASTVSNASTESTASVTNVSTTGTESTASVARTTDVSMQSHQL